MIRLLFPKNYFIYSSFSCSSSCSSSSSARPLLLVQISHFSTSSTYPSPWRRHDDESRSVPVSVWWDFENCNVPGDVNVYKIVHCISEAVRSKGIKGPLQITAFGDVLQLTRAKQEALSSTGINLTHIPNGAKNSADRSLLVDLMYWVSQNPPPAHLFLISGDKDFAGILHRLRMNNYNILLASPDRVPNVLCSAATIMWRWHSLLKGEYLTGKHYNHPPDGPLGSWYGHHKVPLEDPFSDGEQSTSSQIEEPSEIYSVPKTVVRQIRKILYSYPNGISVSDLRAELAKTDINLDKDYYGYKKFSRFLTSEVRAYLYAGPDKSLFARLIPQKSPQPFDSSHLPSSRSVDNEELNHTSTSKLSDKGENMVRDADGAVVSLCEYSVEDIPEKVQDVVDVANAQVTEHQLRSKENEIFSSGYVSQSAPEKYTTSEDYSAGHCYREMRKNGIANDFSEKLKSEDNYVLPTRKEADEVLHSSYSSPVDEPVTDKSIGGSIETNSNHFSKGLSFFGWIKSWWPFRKRAGNSDILAAHQNKMVSNTEEPPQFSELNKTVKQTDSHSEELQFSKQKQTISHSEMLELSDMKLTVSYSEEPKLSELKQADGHFEEPKLSELKQTDSHSEETRLLELKQTNSHSEEPELSERKQTVGHSEEPELSKPRQIVDHSGEAELFSSNSFWSDMESFVFATKGSILVTRSRSRKDMTLNFKRYGPLVLSSLSENDLLILVDLLISDKKWIEERPSQTFPFHLTPPFGKTSSQSHGANGLRSLFLSGTTQSNLPKSSECGVDKKYQSTPHAVVSSSANKKKPTERSRADILADIQKLVDEILREHPDGYNMSQIPKLFLERYGYYLDFQKLGYQKLVGLLQTMPEVKIESTYIFPIDHAIYASGLQTSILNTQETNCGDVVSDPDGELSASYPKADSKDSPWEELGPVSVDNSNQSDLDPKLRQNALDLETSIHPDYEPSLSDDDSSESEGDSSCLTELQEEGKSKKNMEDSSLLQTLDSWYSSQGEDSVKSDNAGTKGNGLSDSLTLSRESTPGTHSKVHSGYRDKQKPLKSYSFVADPISPKKDQLIDGILHSLKKSDDLKMQN